MSDKRSDPKPRKHPQLWQSYLLWHELIEIRKKHVLRISSVERGKSNLDADFERMLISKLGIGSSGLQERAIQILIDNITNGFIEITMEDIASELQDIQNILTDETLITLDMLVDPKRKVERENSIKQIMINYGQAVGPIWDWCLSYKGLGESLTAQLLAQIDDIEKFATIAKIWRFCGYGVHNYWVNSKGEVQAPAEGNKWVNGEKIFTVTLPKEQWNGYSEAMYQEPNPDWKLIKHRDINVAGYHSPYNRILKAILYNIADQFIRHRSYPWRDIYDEEKERQRERHPVAICKTCNVECNHKVGTIDGKPANIYTCPNSKSHKSNYTDAHIHNIAWRRMIKYFLQELWLEWRRLEGLEVTEPYYEGVN